MVQRLRLLVSPRTQALWAVLNVLPLPGFANLWLGYRNPHTQLARHGIIQLTLFVLGTYPLVIPGAIALAWAIYDAWQIGRARLIPMPLQGPPPLP